MKNRKIIVMLMLILLLVPVFSIGVAASAAYAYDVDFSIKPDKTEVNAGDTFNVDIVITTRKSGYVEFDFELTYDESIVSCELDSYNQDGYTGDGTAEGIFKLTYKDPSNSQTPTPTEKNSEYSVHVAFKAKDVTQKSNVIFKGKINKLSGVNTLDNNKVKALTPATLVDKNVYVSQATNVPESTGSADVSSDSTDPNDMPVGYIESTDGNDVPKQIVEEKNNDTLKIALIIVGGLVVFGSGFVVGYMVNSKKNNSTASVKQSSKKKFEKDYKENDYSDIAGLNNRVHNNISAAEPGNNFQSMSKPEFTAAQPQNFNNTSVPASQNIYTAGNIFVRGNPNMPRTTAANATGSAYPNFGTPLQQMQSQQNKPAYSENTYSAANVPKYGTNFEGTYARYANRQQQMQRTYSQPAQTTGYQMNRPMNNAGTYNPTNANLQSNQQSNQQQQTRTGFFNNPSAQQQYYQNQSNANRYPTHENTAYPTNTPTNSAQYSQNNNNQNIGYKPSQPSPVTGGYKPSNTSSNGFNNRPY